MKKNYFLRIVLFFFFSFFCSKTYSLQSETEPNGTVNDAGTQTIANETTITGDVCLGTGCATSDPVDHWKLQDGISGTFIATWTDNVQVTLFTYSTSARNTAPTSVILTSGNSQTLSSSSFYSISAQFITLGSFTSYSIGLSGSALPALDTTPPSLSSTSPIHNATGANLSTDITLTFDEDIAKGTGNILLKLLSDNSTVESFDVATSGQITVSSSVLTINPTSNLTKGTGYYMEIPSTAIDDTSGNSYAGFTGSGTLSFTTADVVINEIITDPQTDWSTAGFDGSDGGGTVSNVDEAIELYIKASSVNLTGWTLELLDGTDVTGDLTSTGAFDVSNYISSSGGVFTNTAVGDFLVLGNVDGSGAMNNSITINLKDAGGAIVDTVTLGGGAGEAFSGDSGSIGDEAVYRLPNGTDTDNDSADFTKGVATLGATNATGFYWDGSSSTDWGTTSNWATGVLPTSSDNVVILNVTNKPIIGSTTAAVANNLTVDGASSLTIESGGTLIVSGTSSGNVTYNRNLGTATNWYLISSPVLGQGIADFYTNEPNTRLGSGTGFSQNVAIAPYDNTQVLADDRFAYYTLGQVDGLNSDDTTDTFGAGRGYTVSLSTSEDVSFTGTLATTTQSFTLSQGQNNFNLVGNPFTAFITLGTLQSNNSSDIGTNFFFWNGSQYVTRSSGAFASRLIAPAQAFFVEAISTNNLDFNISDRNHGSDNFGQKTSSPRPEINLTVSENGNSRIATVLYIENTTKGFDNGYDGELFRGVTQNFELFTDLVETDGKKYQLQSLPNQDHENMVIPIGLKASANKEITFSSEALNLPTGLKVYLEDRLTSTVTRLDEANSNYKVTLTENLDGIGRFFLHTRSSALSTDDITLEGVNIYAIDKNTLQITGINSDNASVKVFSILGKKVVDSSFSSKGSKEIKLPSLNTGVYIVQVSSEKGKLNKKMVLE